MVDNRTHTLMDLALLEQKPLRKTIYFGMFQGSLPTVMDVLQVKSATSFNQGTLYLTDPGDVHLRNLGGDAGTFQARFGERTETLKLIHDKMIFDPVQLEVKDYVQDPVELNLRQFAQTVRAKVNDLFINGDPTLAGNKEFAGIDFRMKNDALFGGQSVDANGLDVDASDANTHTWLDLVDEAIDLSSGVPDYAVINRQTKNKFKSVLRRAKLLDTTQDQFNRKVIQYGDVKFVDAGMKPSGLLSPASTGQVIGNNTHTSVFNDANTTPMFFCKTNGEEGVSLLQLYSMRVKKIGINPERTSEFVVDMHWPIGLVTPVRFCLSSVQGLVI